MLTKSIKKEWYYHWLTKCTANKEHSIWIHYYTHNHPIFANLQVTTTDHAVHLNPGSGFDTAKKKHCLARAKTQE